MADIRPLKTRIPRTILNGTGDLCYQSTRADGQRDTPIHLLSESYDQQEYSHPQPAHIPYSVEWKLTANNRIVTKDSEQNIVIPPEAFWRTCLRAKLRDVLDKKLPSTKTFEAVDTDIIVSVNDRSQRDLIKRFDKLNVNWSMLEAQLQTWSHLNRIVKSLRIDLCFNYKQKSLSCDKSSRRSNKRGRPSVCDQMLSDRDLQLSAEQSSTGLSPVWPDVYNLMRCTGPPCRAGPYCWRDASTSRHFGLKTHHLRTLIEHVENGGILQGHDDVPDYLRDQLYAEEQQRRERQRRRTTSSAVSDSIDQVNDPVMHLSTGFDIPGLRDDALKEYSDWQCSKVRGEDLKMDFRKACELALKDGLDLELIHKNPDTAIFIEGGVRRGIAMRFVSDVEDWVKRYSHN
ncbi:hypothetical protein LX36DRAFT_685960 [Colletotrichum falcatum]|nr:hypothetical protein LX36DRAFT_685960 [Colletotrichum falcatum]